MKKHQRIIALGLALIMALALAACGGTRDEEDTPSDNIGDVAATYAPTASPSAEPSPDHTAPVTPAPTPSATPKPEVTVAPTTEPVVEPSVAPTDPVQDPNSVDLTAFFNTITSTYQFSGLMDMDSVMLDNYYPGLTGIATKQLIAKMPMITASANEFVLVECENASDAATVRGIFEARKQAQADGGAWYPETIEQWKSAQICVSGNYVMLICHENAADIAASFYALF